MQSEYGLEWWIKQLQYSEIYTSMGCSWELMYVMEVCDDLTLSWTSDKSAWSYKSSKSVQIIEYILHTHTYTHSTHKIVHTSVALSFCFCKCCISTLNTLHSWFCVDHMYSYKQALRAHTHTPVPAEISWHFLMP